MAQPDDPSDDPSESRLESRSGAEGDLRGELIVNDRPDNTCFGCGPRNPRGLQLAFRATPEGAEADYEAAEDLCGAPGVVHGGVQATLLDEVLGMTLHLADPDPALDVVTAEFTLRYRRPVPTRTPLLIRGRLVRQEGRDYFLEGEILLAEADAGVRAGAGTGAATAADAATASRPPGRPLTRAEARWRRIPTRRG